jgi:hypothetical protein
MTASALAQLRKLSQQWRDAAAAEQRVSFCADDLDAVLAALGGEPPASPTEDELADAIRSYCEAVARLKAIGLHQHSFMVGDAPPPPQERTEE